MGIAAQPGPASPRVATASMAPSRGNPELQAALQAGNKTSEQRAQRISQALQESGGAEDTGNPVLETHYEVSRTIR